eukprot:CAMPEP_0114362624 /NCGR_PEP_ID=MMETSP0101-20121206/25817_1 /TAXON_ID=38822 ORGANISM="Pteridomonas danica, Strain PT" /NCGR_SAMPLE_ID=MMETSP0101 /ASSEMBLY_ACC=CAM_ASM_000211 /LENGTH=72 /DNA_ID=CAMNT_0001508581 /DNA_START=774 /DNA_END=992 /DNA_ORIENTATION=-
MEKKINDPEAGTLLEYAATFGEVDFQKKEERDTPSTSIVKKAIQNLKDYFRIGITEEMDSFLVLVSLDTGWD